MECLALCLHHAIFTQCFQWYVNMLTMGRGEIGWKPVVMGCDWLIPTGFSVLISYPVIQPSTSLYLPAFTPMDWKLRSHISSHWLKNVSGCMFAWHNNLFPKICKLKTNENDKTSFFNSTGSEVVFSDDTHPENGAGKCQGCFSFCFCMHIWLLHLQMTSTIFGSFRASSGIFGYVCTIFGNLELPG